MRVWRKIDKTLRSPTLTVALICIIGIGSVFGTIPVGPLEAGGGVIGELIRALGGGRLYRTWWYTLLLACLAFLMLAVLNPSLDRQSRELHKEFFCASYVVLALWLGYGLVLLGGLLVKPAKS